MCFCAALAAIVAMAGAQQAKIGTVLTAKTTLELNETPVQQALETLLKGKIAYKLDGGITGKVACSFKDWPLEDILRGLTTQVNATFEISNDSIVIRTKHLKLRPVLNTVYAVTHEKRQKEIKAKIDGSTKIADEAELPISLTPTNAGLMLTERNRPFVGRIQFIDIRDNTKLYREFYFECKSLGPDDIGPAINEKDQAKLYLPWARSKKSDTTAIVDIVYMDTGIRQRQVIGRSTKPADGQAKPLQG